MTDVSVQIYAAAFCVLIGAGGGLLYEGVGIFRAFVPITALRAAADVLFFCLFAALSVSVGAAVCLPDFRPYMLAAVVLGFWAERKSLHRILAFFARRLYNKYRSGCKRRLLRLTRKICRKKNLKKLS